MNLIFSYKLDDAWSYPISGITVYDTNVDNVVCYTDHESVKSKYTIPKESIRAICEVVEKNREILELKDEDIERVLVIDGTSNIFLFSDGNRQNTLQANNMWAFQDKGPCSEKAQIVISVFENISAILQKDGVDQCYLTLG